MLHKLTSWAMVPSNVWRLTSQVAVPSNVVEDNILGCCAKQCHKGWHLRSLCQTMSKRLISYVAMPSNVIKVDISAHFPEQCREGWHLRSYCQAMSLGWHHRPFSRAMLWKVTSWVVFPNNVVKVEISSCFPRQYHAGWHLRSYC